jgi:hypothetical protein
MISFKDFIKEEESDDTAKIIKSFVDFASERLGIKKHPKVKLIQRPQELWWISGRTGQDRDQHRESPCDGCHEDPGT